MYFVVRFNPYLFYLSTFIQSMANKSSQKLILPEKYIHQLDQRTDNQIYLSNQIIRVLTQLNLNRVTLKDKENMQNAVNLQNKYTFLCIAGAPKLPGQFENLDLPGERIIYCLTGFQGQYTREQYYEIYKSLSLQTEAENIHNIICKIPQDRKLVIVFHSFGSFMLLVYLRKYGSSRISGFVDLGGIPITMYLPLGMGMKVSLKFSDEQFISKWEQIYEIFKKAVFGGFDPFQNKYHGMLFMKTFKDKNLQTVFQQARNYPKILKLIVFGRRDLLFEQKLLNEKAVHYCYVNKLPQNAQNSYRQAYKELYGTQTKNIQQRFVFNLDKGSHSVHYQPKFVPTLNMIIKQYIQILDRSTK